MYNKIENILQAKENLLQILVDRLTDTFPYVSKEKLLTDVYFATYTYISLLIIHNNVDVTVQDAMHNQQVYNLYKGACKLLLAQIRKQHKITL